MAKENTQRDYLKALEQSEKPVADEYRKYVRVTTASATILILEKHLREQDVDALLRDLAITGAALGGVNEAIRNAYLSGGEFEAPAARIQFDIRNPRAESWLRFQSSDLVTRITQAQRDAIRITLESSMRIGRNPRQTALDIVGRVGATGRRSGGIVGLSGPQSQYVSNAREQLLSGDPATMREYFNRTRRDRRFDGIVKRAIAAGKPVASRDVDRIAGRYADRLLEKRGVDIAITESLQSFNAARQEAAQQAIDQGIIDQGLTTAVWVHTSSRNPRDFHISMNGQKQPIGVPFQSPTGAKLMYPGDSSLGAGASDTVRCKCMKRVRYSYLEDAARRAA
ncbi:MAG: hypothetical protein CMN85_10620 [Spongiibacteraceae bacterium]|nr:hypothetical protein [Spongiibacteraceae bacterium]|tara:strand:+ start:19403 stop:20419 length:1017 start_codon:yes stop_codon:yes gene_type:complete